MGAPLAAVFTRGAIGAHRANSLLAKARQNEAAESDGWIQRKDDETIWCSTAATALPGEDGQPGGCVVVIRT